MEPSFMVLSPRVLLYGFCALCFSAFFGVKVALVSGHESLPLHLACTLALLQRFRGLEGLAIYAEALPIMPLIFVTNFFRKSLLYEDTVPEVIRKLDEMSIDRPCVCPFKGQLPCLMSVPKATCVNLCAEYIPQHAWASARFSSLVSSALRTRSIVGLCAVCIPLLSVTATTIGTIWLMSFLKRDIHSFMHGVPFQSMQFVAVRNKVGFVLCTKIMVSCLRPLVREDFWQSPACEAGVRWYTLNCMMELASELYWFAWMLWMPLLCCLSWTTFKLAALKLVFAFQAIASELDRMRNVFMEMHICRLTDYVFSYRNELDYVGHIGEDDVCALCLDALCPAQTQCINRFVEPCTAVQRLKPRMRVATPVRACRPLLVRMGPCRHVFHRSCFTELVKHKQCPNCNYAFLQCPTCRAELTQVRWWAPACLRPLLQFVLSRVSLWLVNRIVASLILITCTFCGFKMMDLAQYVAIRVLRLLKSL